MAQPLNGVDPTFSPEHPQDEASANVESPDDNKQSGMDDNIEVPPPTPPHHPGVIHSIPIPDVEELEVVDHGNEIEVPSTHTVTPARSPPPETVKFEGAQKPRMIRFNSRVRISAGIPHHPHSNPSSPPSESSSISVPLHNKSIDRAPTFPSASDPTTQPVNPPSAGTTFSMSQAATRDSFSQWLEDENESSRLARGRHHQPGHSLGNPNITAPKGYGGIEGADETTPMLAHKRRRALRGSKVYGATAGTTAEYVIANSGIPKGDAPVPQKHPPMSKSFIHEEDEEFTSDYDEEDGYDEIEELDPRAESMRKWEEDLAQGASWSSRIKEAWSRIGALFCGYGRSSPESTDYQ